MTLLLCLVSVLVAGESRSGSPQSEVVLTSLANPVYPRLAKIARIAGDVELKLSIRADGTVESADMISGPAMLKQPVLDSVRESRFECRECSENVTSYRMVYTFQLAPVEYGPNCEVKVDATYPQVSHSQDHVTIIDQVGGICDPAETISKVRSAKCLYLWRCGRR